MSMEGWMQYYGRNTGAPGPLHERIHLGVQYRHPQQRSGCLLFTVSFSALPFQAVQPEQHRLGIRVRCADTSPLLRRTDCLLPPAKKRPNKCSFKPGRPVAASRRVATSLLHMPTRARTNIKVMLPSNISLASLRFSTLKGKASQYRDDSNTSNAGVADSVKANGGGGWKQWAGQNLKRRLSKSDSKIVGNEKIVLFPGWAERRYKANVTNSYNAGAEPFEVDVFVSGYASARRPPELATRSQRAVLHIAKSFAALPKLVSDAESAPTTPLSRSAENLQSGNFNQLPPLPNEITEEDETQVFERRFLEMDLEDQEADSRASSPVLVEENKIRQPIPPALITIKAPTITDDTRKLHANLESRLRPFWSTALSSRQIRIQLFAPHNGPSPQQADGREPIASKDVVTAADGFFSAKLTITWEEICRHPEAAHIAYDDPGNEPEMYIEVELLPSSPAARNDPVRVEEASVPLSARKRQELHLDFRTLKRTVTSTLMTPLTHSSIRVISDIDDTIKFSNILRGARAAFHNVFVKELTDTTIPGMTEWYDQMWKQGVRFHYVSNGPFELLPVVEEFLNVSQLPPGSIKLKSYTGRSLFNGLMSAPASRKRAGVVEVLDSFPNSLFFLIGDTGEQDLELYASLAAERPNQIIGVFLRDAMDNAADPSQEGGELTSPNSPSKSATTSSTNSAEDPTGMEPQSEKKRPPQNYFTTSPLSEEPETYIKSSTPPSAFQNFRIPSPSRSSTSLSSMPRLGRRLSVGDSGRRRNDFQMRVWRARMQIPSQIPLRVFRQPHECVEVWEILERVRDGTFSDRQIA